MSTIWFMKMKIMSQSSLPYYSEGYPIFSDDLQEWCKETLGYVPEIVWTGKPSDNNGVKFKSESDMVMFKIAAPTTSLVWISKVR